MKNQTNIPISKIHVETYKMVLARKISDLNKAIVKLQANRVDIDALLQRAEFTLSRMNAEMILLDGEIAELNETCGKIENKVEE